MPKSQPSVSIIGLGLMGSAIASTFLGKGWKTTIWNRSSAKAAPLATKGAIVAASPANCIQASDLIIVCLLNTVVYHQVLKVCTADLCKDQTLINFTTCAPSDAESSKKAAADAGFSAYIQGVIMTMPNYVGRPESIFWYSGNETAFKAQKEALEVLGTPLFIDNDVTSSVIYDAIHLNGFYGLVSGYLHSMTLLRNCKLYVPGAAQQFTKDILAPSLAHANELLAEIARQVDEKDYLTKGDGARLGQHIHGLDIFKRTNEENGVSSLVFDPLIQAIKMRISQGGEDEELGGLVEVLTTGNQDGPNIG